AAGRAARANLIEPRTPCRRPLDVLAQHIVTIGCSGPFDELDLLREVRTTHAYRELTDDDWRWCMDFALRGGSALSAYPQFARIVPAGDAPGRYRIASKKIETMHR